MMSHFQMKAHHGTERSTAYQIQREKSFLRIVGDEKGYKKKYSHYGIVEA